MEWLKLVLLCALLAVAQRGAVDGLQWGFYSGTCPQAEKVVRDAVNLAVANDRRIAAGLIRLFFHDCFVTGCDASILLDESPTGEVPEKLAPANGFTLIGLDTIDSAKATLESLCPQRVSCADILAFAARDAAVAAGLPSYEVLAGRLDAVRSNMDDLRDNFPEPSHHVPRLTELFAQRRLTQEDLVVLSGAHSIGGAHCNMFTNRLYGFSATAVVDPALDPKYAAWLRQMCPPLKPNDPERPPKVNFDAQSEDQLDNWYYSDLLAGRGLLTSDSVLVEDPQTRAMVEAFAKNNALWQRKFAEAMQKVGAIVGERRGQVRTQCRWVNRPAAPQWPAQPAFPCRPPQLPRNGHVGR